MDISGGRRLAIHKMWQVCGCFAAILLAAGLDIAPETARAAPGDTPAVTAVRIGAHGDTTRFVLELTEPAAYQLFLLPDPYRAVIDLPEVEWRLPSGAESARGAITGMRHGLFRPGTARIVLDLDQPVAVAKSFTLPPASGNQHRIVIDLKPTGRDAFLAALRSPAAQPPPAPSRPAPATPPRRVPGKRVVAIDPGHGGVDPGTVGRGGAIEKEVTLAHARALRRALLATGRFDVVMTRDRDVFVQLRDRIRIAQEAGAEVLLSFHADALADRRVRGASVYTLSETASDAEAAALAAKENKADLIAGIDLTDHSAPVAQILIELAQRVTMNASAVLARELVEEMKAVTPMLQNTHRFAGFAVLKAPEVPSVLVEIGYLSNTSDERQLRDPRFRARLADGMVRALDRYFANHQALKRP
jgi:N-acetylmuramoyl-L-alanine amidase